MMLRCSITIINLKNFLLLLITAMFVFHIRMLLEKRKIGKNNGKKAKKKGNILKKKEKEK